MGLVFAIDIDDGAVSAGPAQDEIVAGANVSPECEIFADGGEFGVDGGDAQGASGDIEDRLIVFEDIAEDFAAATGSGAGARGTVEGCFVSVAGDFRRRNRRQEAIGGIGDAGLAGQESEQLGIFAADFFRIGEMGVDGGGQGAETVVDAHQAIGRRESVGRRFEDLEEACLPEGGACFGNDGADAFAEAGTRNEIDRTVEAGDAIAAESDIGDCQLDRSGGGGSG